MTPHLPMLRRVAIPVVMLALPLLAAAPAGAVTRYADPDSAVAVAPCSAAAPCTFSGAVAAAAPGDDVLVRPGDYYAVPHTPASPITTGVTMASAHDIHGAPGGPRPVIHFNTPLFTPAVNLNPPGSRLADLAIVNDGKAGVLAGDATVERLLVRVNGVSGYACGASGTLGLAVVRDSVCIASGLGGSGVEVSLGLAGPGMPSFGQLRNVTARAPGALGVGVKIDAGAYADIRIDALGLIADGAATDVKLSAWTGANPGKVRFKVGSSALTLPTVVPADGDVTIVNTAPSSILTGAPIFSAVAGAPFGPSDYVQLAGSPTIDKGAVDAATGTLDVDGRPRTLGGGPDIGAHELAVAPSVLTGVASAITSGGATVAGKIIPAGLPTTWHVEYGPTASYGSATPDRSAGTGLPAVAVSEPLSGLPADAVVHYRLVATNAAGSAVGSDATFRTAVRPPGTGPIPPPVLAIRNVRMAPQAWRIGRATPRASARRRRHATPVGTTISFTLSVAATPRLSFLRVVPGVRRGRACRAVRRAPRRGRCTALKPAGTLTLRRLSVGTHRVRFAGRLDRRRTLRPGRYRLRLSARAGRATATARDLGFRVLPRR